MPAASSRMSLRAWGLAAMISPIWPWRTRAGERAPVEALFAEPQHPYTIGLLGALPKLHDDKARLATIEGTVPNPLALPQGCSFHPRCPFADAECRRSEPPLRELQPRHFAACLKAPLREEA